MACAPCEQARAAKAKAEEQFKAALTAGDLSTATSLAKKWGFVVGAGAAAMVGLISKETLTNVVNAQDIVPPSSDTPKGVPAPNMRVNP